MSSLISSTLLSTTLFIFFILPGFIFLRSYLGTQKGVVNANSLYSYIIWGVLLSALFFIGSLELYNRYCQCFCWDKILLIDVCKPILDNDPNTNLNLEQVYRLIKFSVLLDITVLILGWLLQQFVLFFRLDLLLPILKFKNDMYYLLDGREFIREKKFPRSFSVHVDFLCVVGGKACIYKGKLFDYKIKNEELEALYIVDVKRTAFDKVEAFDTVPESSKNFFEKMATALKSNPADEKKKAEITESLEKPFFYPLDSLSYNSVMVFRAKDITNIRISYIPISGKRKRKTKLTERN